MIATYYATIKKEKKSISGLGALEIILSGLKANPTNIHLAASYPTDKNKTTIYFYKDSVPITIRLEDTFLMPEIIFSGAESNVREAKEEMLKQVPNLDLF